MKTILITGSGGLIGSACVDYFKDVYESVTLCYFRDLNEMDHREKAINR